MNSFIHSFGGSIKSQLLGYSGISAGFQRFRVGFFFGEPATQRISYCRNRRSDVDGSVSFGFQLPDLHPPLLPTSKFGPDWKIKWGDISFIGRKAFGWEEISVAEASTNPNIKV